MSPPLQKSKFFALLYPFFIPPTFTALSICEMKGKRFSICISIVAVVVIRVPGESSQSSLKCQKTHQIEDMVSGMNDKLRIECKICIHKITLRKS